MKDTLIIHEQDNVAVALRDLEKGTKVQSGVELQENVSRGHKIALRDLHENNNVVKYGFPIGHATAPIKQGSVVHTHNAKTNLRDIQSYTFHQKLNKSPYKQKNLIFNGFKRTNGNVGIRNELWIVPTVGCVNGIADLIIQQFKNERGGDVSPFENVLVLKHNYGCSQLGDDHEQTKQILADAINHPNAGGVLVLGLGCENNNIEELRDSLGDYDAGRVKFLLSQEADDEIQAGVECLHAIWEAAKEDQREAAPLSKLNIGLKCGGSDGFSGITANPLLGRFSDFLTAQGGTTVLTEVPEMFGAETILMERAENEEVFQKIVALINEFKQYFMDHNQPVYENPSPGNKDGGITTLEDKSLGCTQKAGTSTIVDVLPYGGTLKKPGLNLLSAPGNDLVASSALAAAGCQMVLFTTGRGTPFGSFVPTVKIATNTPLYEKKRHWIDYNAGTLIEDISEDIVLEDFIQYIIRVASGEWVNNEKNNFRELAIFKTGVTL